MLGKVFEILALLSIIQITVSRTWQSVAKSLKLKSKWGTEIVWEGNYTAWMFNPVTWYHCNQNWWLLWQMIWGHFLNSCNFYDIEERNIECSIAKHTWDDTCKSSFSIDRCSWMGMSRISYAPQLHRIIAQLPRLHYFCALIFHSWGLTLSYFLSLTQSILIGKWLLSTDSILWKDNKWFLQ